MSRDEFTPEADGVGFDPTGTDLTSDTAGEAIRELFDIAQGTSKGYVLASYGGNANTGRYLELFPTIAMDDAPLYTPDPLEVLTIVSETTAADATCTLGWYNITPTTPVLLHTTTFTADKIVLENGGVIFSIPAEARLAIKVDSGSIGKPHLYFVLKGA